MTVAQFFCHLTVNKPDQEFFDQMIELCDNITEVEKARLRICLTVAHATLFICYSRKMVGILGPDFQRKYVEALLLELAKTTSEVLLEDYAVLEEERTAFLTEHAARYRTKVTPEGKHLIYASDLIFGLITIRLDGFSASLSADMESEAEGLQPPFMQVSHFVVQRFLGKNPVEASYGGALMWAINQELTATLTALINALKEASENNTH